jgi:uncharacterized cupredoxin-like copper-binding protein
MTASILMTVGGLLIVAVIAVLVLGIQIPLQPSGGGGGLKPTVNLTLYAGEVSLSKFGFGLSDSEILSPGPTLTFKMGDVVEMTVHNVGKVPHAWGITDGNVTGANILFNSAVGSSSNPLPPGGSGSSVFELDQAGDFYYICPVPGHAELGMWGRAVVQP